MKNLMLIIVFSLLCAQTFAVVNPRSVHIRVYALGVSRNADCSNPILVAKHEDQGGKEFNFKARPFLGGAKVDDGTYPCVIMKMRDVIRFTPDTTEGSCIAGTEYTVDVCRAGSGTYTPISGGVYGATINCTGSNAAPIDDRVLLFLSTQSTNTGAGSTAFVVPDPGSTSTPNGFLLNGAFVVSGSKSATFVVNFNNKVDGSGASCELQPPVFGFQ